jgi:ankyrin repeat protein
MQNATRQADEADATSSSEVAPRASASQRSFGSLSGAPSDQAARLRAAAAAGRTADIAALLDQGVPVDAPDASGDTALIKSVEADHPAAAALLRRHGASLDRKNHVGESARDIATAKDDPELKQAVGLGP